MINDGEIDLTENRDFRGENTPPLFNVNISSYIKRYIDKQFYDKYPWRDKKLKQMEGYFPYDGLFALGNKESRKGIVETYYWGTSENRTCDCCGKKYIKMPWKSDAGLCKNCRISTKNIGKSPYPWR